MRINGNAVVPQSESMCSFCGSIKNVTKEHVIPRWVFENDPDKFFKTDVNGIRQTYNKTTIPACEVCNSDLLNSLEKYIQQIFTNRDLKVNFFTE